MKPKTIAGLALPLLWATSMVPATADTTAAECDLFHHGDRDAKHSGPCQFSQRQGYVTIRLKNDKTFELSPTDEPRHYRDQKGHQVKLRDANANSSIYKWEKKRLEVHWNRGDSQDGGHHSGASMEPGTTTERVRFDPSQGGTELSGRLTPGSSVRYVLGAKDRQNLYVRVAAKGPDISYQIFNPDGSFLLDQINSSKEYRGQLWQSGDHVIEVINRGRNATSYNVIFGID